MKVWLAWTDGQDRFLTGVYASRGAAAEDVKATYGAADIATWREEEDRLIGDFQDVRGKSTRHTAVWRFEERLVDGLESER